jgi:hypothetical protein
LGLIPKSNLNKAFVKGEFGIANFFKALETEKWRAPSSDQLKVGEVAVRGSRRAGGGEEGWLKYCKAGPSFQLKC